MASREEIERLRQLARKRHRAATAKVSRLKKTHDVPVAGTPLDPRRNAADISTMRSRDLEAYIRKLNNFTSRETFWVHGAGKKTLLTGSLYNRFESLKKQVNAKREKPYETVKDIYVPTLKTTVEGFQGKKPKHPVTQNPSSRAPHLPIITTNKGIPNDRQLKKLIKNLENQLKNDYGDKAIHRDQKSMRTFFKDMGKADRGNKDLKQLRKDFWDLTPAQFAFLWNYTNFADAASMDYEIAKDHLHDKKQLAEKSDQFKTQIRHMQSLVNDVKRMKF